MAPRSLFALPFALACCAQPDPVQLPTARNADPDGFRASITVPPAPKPNPFVDEVRRQRAKWTGLGLTDYVFVVDLGLHVFPTNMMMMRVVVRDDRVTEASSLQYGGTAPIAHVPTMDALFDRAERFATFGEGNVPARFEGRFDPVYGHPLTIDADARATIADDESRFEVACFSAKQDGCSAIPITEAQCLGAGGSLQPVDAGCGSGWSLGLVDAAQLCCRTYSEVSYDELTADQCRAAAGSETQCTSDMLFVGASQKRRAYCCRQFVR